MFCRCVQLFTIISVVIVCATSDDHYRRREKYLRRSYDERPSHTILSGSSDGSGYELQLDGNSHITSYLKALDVPEPLYRNPHIIASFDESLIPQAMARRFAAQRRASEAEAASASTAEKDQTTSKNQTSEEVIPEKKKEEPIKPVELDSPRKVEMIEQIRQEKESLDMQEPEEIIKEMKIKEQLNPLESRLPIGGRMTKTMSEDRYQDISDARETSSYREVPSRRDPVDRRPTIRVTQMETQEFRERGKGSAQEPKEFVLLMDSGRSGEEPSLRASLRNRPRGIKNDYLQKNSRQTILVPVPFEQSTSIRDLRSQSYREAQLGSPSRTKMLQAVPENEQDPRTRIEQMVKEAMREQRDEQNSGMEEVRYSKSSSSRSPLVNSCLQLCSCCSALMGKNLVPLLV